MVTQEFVESAPAPNTPGPPQGSEIKELDPSRRIGTKLVDRYKLLRQLGVGGAGVVYAAYDEACDEQVAVKILHDHLRTFEGPTARFRREVQAMSAINHPAVVEIRDAGSDGTALFLVMDLLEGQVLLDRINYGLSVREVVQVGVQLLGALQAAHHDGFVHRDIKPENLFLVDGDDISLRVLDFGIAKLVRPDTSLSFMTLDGMILGTPEYMSPETCRGKEASQSADLWASAAVLYHACTGVPPFEDRQVARLMLSIVNDRAPFLREVRPDLPTALTGAIDRALTRRIEDRFQSAGEFTEALSQAL